MGISIKYDSGRFTVSGSSAELVPEMGLKLKQFLFKSLFIPLLANSEGCLPIHDSATITKATFSTQQEQDTFFNLINRYSNEENALDEITISFSLTGEETHHWVLVDEQRSIFSNHKTSMRITTRKAQFHLDVTNVEGKFTFEMLLESDAFEELKNKLVPHWRSAKPSELKTEEEQSCTIF